MNSKFSKFCSLSLICADPLSLRSDLSYLQKLGLTKVHLDIMDASFVPRFGLYHEISKLIKEEFDFEFEAHFMVSNVLHSLSEWRKYHNLSKISFHYSGNESKIEGIIDTIRSEGSEALIAFDLALEDKLFLDVINKYKPDGVMLLGIVPGVLIQNHKPDRVLQRLKLLQSFLEFPLGSIQIDGGVNFSTVSDLINEGATDLVCGSSTIYKNVSFEGAESKKAKILRNIESLEALINV